MQQQVISIRPFIGANNFAISRSFYKVLGFEESIISHNMSYFNSQGLGFYLQDASVKDWIDNTMVFMEVANVQEFYNGLLELNLAAQFPAVRLVPIKHLDWGSECFLHDPSGVLWHFGEFRK